MTRKQLRDAIERRLRGCDAALAMWEAGSAAFGRADQYSDLDLGLLARDGQADAVWKAVDDALEDVGGVDVRWVLGDSLFKGMQQRVYLPTRADKWLQLDIGVFQESAEDLYLQTQRHGQAEVVFDHVGRTAPPVFDARTHARKMGEALHQHILRWRVHKNLFRKELARGRNVDAFAFYLGMVVRNVLTVLGMLHRPDRWDYGFRYVKEDMPPDAVRLLERLCYVAEPAMLEERFVEAEMVFVATVAALKQKGVVPIDPAGLDVVR